MSVRVVCVRCLLLIVVSISECDQIAEMRRKLQKIGRNKVLFLDETALRLNVGPLRTLVSPHQQPNVLATDTSSYAPRFDMIACCIGDQVLLPKIYTPKERADADVKGINTVMVHQFIDDVLAQAVEGLNRYPITLVLDRASIHTNTESILQAFRDRSSESIKQILLMPPNAAKRMSPLDNALFHDWKQECRKRAPATKTTIQRIMNDAWNKMNPTPHYKHCGLMRGQDPYFDCPNPAIHRHGR